MYVREAHLSLDANAPLSERQDDVDRSWIVGRCDWGFELPAKTARDDAPKPFDQLDVRLVSNRSSAWERSNGWIKAECGRDVDGVDDSQMAPVPRSMRLILDWEIPTRAASVNWLTPAPNLA